MENKKEYLKERLTFRQKLFLEWAFVDRRLIQDSRKFIQETREIEDEIMKLMNEELKREVKI